MQVHFWRQRETCPLSSVPETDLSPVSFINPALCAPLQKPGLFCKAAESVGGHTEPVGGSPPGHCWPWLSSQRPRGDWQDPLQKLPQGPGRARVRLQSHTSGQSVRNGETDKSEDGGLCCSWIYRLSGKETVRERKTLTNWGIYLCTCTAGDGRHAVDGALGGRQVVYEWTVRVVNMPTNHNRSRWAGTCCGSTNSPHLSFKNLSEDGL